jgi:chemotaxis protein CheD
MSTQPADTELPPIDPQFEGVTRYVDPYTGCATAKLLPGQFFVGGERDCITTVVGACLTVCLYDASAGFGGMLQLLLPAPAGRTGTMAAPGFDAVEREAFVRMEALVTSIERAGGRRERVAAKLFGAAVIDPEMSESARETLRLVRDYLRTANIREESADTGLLQARKVMFYPAEGRVRLKKLGDLPNDTLPRREREYYATALQRRAATRTRAD